VNFFQAECNVALDVCFSPSPLRLNKAKEPKKRSPYRRFFYFKKWFLKKIEGLNGNGNATSDLGLQNRIVNGRRRSFIVFTPKLGIGGFWA